MVNCFFVGLGGFIGSVLRYAIGLAAVETGDFPLKTLIINVLGSFLIGVITAYTVKSVDFNTKYALMLKTGICGGFTTFSTFALETGNLIEKGNAAAAFIYVLLSVCLGIGAVFAGQAVIN